MKKVSFQDFINFSFCKKSFKQKGKGLQRPDKREKMFRLKVFKVQARLLTNSRLVLGRGRKGDSEGRFFINFFVSFPLFGLQWVLGQVIFREKGQIREIWELY